MTNPNATGMIVRLSISAWSGVITDKEVGDDVAARYAADKSMGAYRKKLVDPKTISGVRACATSARADHKTLTRSWGDDGDARRLVPFANLQKHKEALIKHQVDFEEQVEMLIKSYDEAKDDARRSLGALYRDEDYPSSEDLRSKFSFNISYEPIPDGSFVPLTAPERDALVEQVERETTAKLAEGTQNLFFRIRNQLQSTKKTLDEYIEKREAGTRTKIHISLVENMLELVNILPSLNITNDEFLSNAIARLRLEFQSIDINTLREDLDECRRVGERVERALESLPD